MTNFDYLTSESQFDSFSHVAVAAEKSLPIDASTSVLNCRRAMEFAVKWLYSVDEGLVMPWDNKLAVLIHNPSFQDFVDEPDLIKRMDFIRKAGNNAAHRPAAITKDMAELCLEDLYYFLDFVACCYSEDYQARNFNKSLLNAEPPKELVPKEFPDIDVEALIAENASLKEELTARREEQQQNFVPKPLDITEYETRKVYIDTMLIDAGWTQGKDWIDEVELPGMLNKHEVGYADYVLYDDTHKPLAVIEAKRTCADVAKGRQQAKLYADLLQKKYGRRPVIFLTNGFDTRIDDGVYPERRVSMIYSKRDLEKLFNLRTMKTSLRNVFVDKNIAGRYYQEGAIKSVCHAFEVDNERKALLVMATGSGKTRTVIGLVDILLQHGWIKNVLFLADRNSLVTQAKRSFVNLLPSLSVTNLVEEKDNLNAHGVFSTYQTMMNCIDSAKDDDGKIFTSGHFDLVICDEAHRSIYNKYQDIFNYFDAPLVGLTATPKDEIDKNTYSIFNLANGYPTYGYELAQAVTDGYLVDFVSIESKVKFLDEGIHYDELSDEDREAYEETFADEDGVLPESINASALNEYIFNKDTIREVLNVLMTEGIRVDYGQKIGKTIIFAKNHKHAEKIFEVFNEEYPSLKDYAKVIDNYTNYAQSLIDEFSDANKLPQIAISVDMLDTGIDVPEVVNLVFFKKVMSKAKFWQMIGRGTRLCPELLDGNDKDKFYIFDFCGNFEFFRMGGKGTTQNMMPLQGALFALKAEMAFKLQDLVYQTDELIAFRKELVDDMVSKVRELNRENFAVRQHLKYVDMYSNPDNYIALDASAVRDMRNELCLLILPYEDEAKALRFDALMYGLELAYLVGKKDNRRRGDLLRKASGMASMGTIPAITAQSELIHQILHTDLIERAGIDEFENIREKLRDLVKYIPSNVQRYDTDFDDEILSTEWRDSDLSDSSGFENYKIKAEHYIRQHIDESVIGKLHSNVPLTGEDIAELENILWSELGTKEDYEAEFGEKPLGEFVREIVGMDMNAAKEAFSFFLNDVSLDEKQIYFVNQIVEYIVHNGMLKDFSVFQEPPFTDKGSVVTIFGEQMIVWQKIVQVINQINANAVAA